MYKISTIREYTLLSSIFEAHTKINHMLASTMEKAMAPHSSTLAWKIPWTEEPGRLQSTRSLRVRHDWATSLSLSCIGEGNGNPLQCSCLENPRDGGAWWAAVFGVTQSRTQLKQLSSSSSFNKFPRSPSLIIMQLSYKSVFLNDYEKLTCLETWNTILDNL